MNVFVLSTGRCGSVTFTKACSHISNFSAAHESRARIVGDAHFDYPDNHIEIDNRLTWFLGRIDQKYGTESYYVHLIRDQQKVAESYRKRFGSGIVRAYTRGMMMGRHPKSEAMDICMDYWKTANANISLFLKDKPNQMEIRLETARTQFAEFWNWIGAEGDLTSALEEWSVSHNRTTDPWQGLKKMLGIIRAE